MTTPPGEPAVAVDVTPLLGPRTGIGTFVAELLDALALLDAPPQVVPYVVSRRARLESGAVPAGTRRLPLPASLALRWWGRFDTLGFDGRLEPASVVHGTNYVVPPVRHRRAVVTVHDCAFVRYPELCSPVTRAYEPVVRRAIARGAVVHTPTRSVAEEVRTSFGADDVRPIAHGIPRLDISAGQAPAPVDGPFVLCLGTLEPRKRPERVVEAFGHVALEHPDLALVLAGKDGPSRAAVDRAVSGLPVEVRGRVHVLGHVAPATRSSLLHHARALMQAPRYEGFGLPLLEAMQAGTPVVTTEGGGALVEVAAGAAFVVADDSAETLAAALAEVITDEGLRDRLVTAGYGRAREFGWQRTAEQFASLYREVAGG